MFHFLEYPFSRGWTHITSPDPYAAPDFDAGFMNDERDMVPMVWGYIKSRETARRMDAYAGEVQNMHPFFDYDSDARAHDLNLEDTNRYALPGNVTAGIQHGSWSVPVPEPDEKPGRDVVSSNRKEKRKELKYSKKDIEAIEEWVKRHVETTWHCLGVSRHFPSKFRGIQGETDVVCFRHARWRPRRATASSSTVCWTSA
jgi:alcohol oxidase